MGYSLLYVKIDLSQNQNLGTSLERPYKKLLNAYLVLKFITPSSNYGQSKKRKKGSK